MNTQLGTTIDGWVTDLSTIYNDATSIGAPAPTPTPTPAPVQTPASSGSSGWSITTVALGVAALVVIAIVVKKVM